MTAPSILGTAAGASSGSVSHTLSAGDNRIVVGFSVSDGAPMGTASATYGGIAMMRIGYIAEGSTYHYAWYLPEGSLPANGSNTFSASNCEAVAVTAIEDARQGAAFVQEENSNGAASSISKSITTPEDDCLVLSSSSHNIDTSYSSHGSGQTEIIDTSGGGAAICLTHETVTTAGADTQSHTAATSGRITMIAVAIEPYIITESYLLGSTARDTDTANASPSVSHTLAAGDSRKVVLALGWQETTTLTATATYGGNSMTAESRINNGANYVQLFYIDEIDLPPNGANTCSVSLSGGTPDYTQMIVFCMQNIAQGAPDSDNSHNESAQDNLETVTVTPTDDPSVTIVCTQSNSDNFHVISHAEAASPYQAFVGDVAVGSDTTVAAFYNDTGTSAISRGLLTNVGASGSRFAMYVGNWGYTAPSEAAYSGQVITTFL